MKTVSLWTKTLACSLSFLVIAMAGLMSAPAQAAVVLNTADISNFTLLGNAPALAPTTLSFSDADGADVSALYASDPDAAPGSDLDVIVTFQVRSNTPNGPDGGFRVVINDGVTRSAIATTAIINNQRVIALAGGGGGPADPGIYTVYMVVDWLAGPVTLKLRRWANGDAEILEVNGVSPNPRLVLASDQVAGRSRAGATVEFGCMSVEGMTDADVTQFFSEKPNQPPVAKAGTDQSIYVGQTAVLDGSASFDPDGTPIAGYTWKIDAAPAGSTAALSCLTCVNPALYPDRVGAYQMSLVVNDGVLDSAAATVTVTVTANLPPLAMAGATPASGYAPLTVALSAAGSSDPENGPLSYSWNFGDGSPSAIGINPSHTYVSSGGYTAVLTVTDDFGNTAQASAVITVTTPNLPPAVAPTATPTSGTAPLTVRFMAGATDPENDPLSYSWNFGDGIVDSIANPSHIYTTPGTYGATVAVSDGVNPEVTSTGILISVGSPLSLKVGEAKVECGEKGKVEGKINLKAGFTYPGVPLPRDRIVLAFDGLLLFDVPLGSFKQEAARMYEYEARGLHVELDFNKSEIKVARHKILTSSVDNANGIDLALGFGAATGTDHFVMSSHQEREGGRSSEKACDFSYKDGIH
jgi:PKD repeat protein